MAFGAVTLLPGVNVERTPTLLRAGYSKSVMIRYRDGLAQKLGGWSRLYPNVITGTPRDLHAWQDLNEVKRLAVAGTASVSIITFNNSIPPVGTLSNITPQTFTSNFVPNISTTATSNVVTIVDPNVTNPTTYDAVFFNVPISIGGIILDGLYQIASVTGTHSYTILAGMAATASATNPTATNNTTAIGNPTLHFGTTPAWQVDGMVLADITASAAIVHGTQSLSHTSNTIVMTANAASPGVGSGDDIVIAGIPVFTASSGSSLISVFFPAHNLTAGEIVVFPIPTSVGGITVVGSYTAATITDANNFTIQGNVQASGNATVAMNGGEAQLVYYIALGPIPTGVGYGLGLYGEGAYGYGVATGTPQTGTPIQATDWTSDNWGSILLECPKNGALYYWDPNGGFLNMSVISTAPPFNSSLFLSMAEQILVALGSSVHEGIGWQQQPLLVQWSDVGNFFQWEVNASTQAGNFTIPSGSALIAGVAAGNQNLIWTDLDLWAMPYLGPPLVFGFNKIGAGMGAVSAHAVQTLRGSVFWMSPTNFCNYTGNGASVVPCPVWDAVFQNLNTAYLQNVRAMPNTPFNEVGWLFPSLASTSGECDSYVKFNITEQGAPWDIGIGVMPRSAWIDQNVLGNPIGATPTGLIYQHETSPNADGLPLTSSFTTGYFYLQEGEDFVDVQQILMDFIWTIFPGGTSASVQVFFNMLDYPASTPRTYGPYTFTNVTLWKTTRMRGRLMSITVQSSDLNSFWRVGGSKYRYAPSGRR